MAFTTYDEEDHTPEALVGAIFTGSAGLTLVPGSVQVRAGAPAGEASTISFYDGALTALNIGAGLLLTSGDPTPPTSNTGSGYGADAGSGTVDETDADLQATVDFAFEGAGQVRDVTYIQFQVELADPALKGITFEVVFGSDEYPEFSGSSFVDVGGVYVNGVNYALFAGDPKKPLSVVKANLNASWAGFGLNGFFRDNRDANATLPIEYDGVSVKLQITAPLELGINTIKIAIADTGDSALDSGMFVSNVQGTTFAGFGIAQQVFVPDTGIIDIPGNQIYVGGDWGTTMEFGSAGGGYDIYDGGNGVDQAKFEATLGEVSYEFVGDALTIGYPGNHTVELKNVEHIAFGDGTFVALDTDVGENTWMVYAMLNAWFDDLPDTGTLSQWIGRSLQLFEVGLGYTELGDAIVSTYRDTPYLEDVVARLYENIVGEAAAPEVVATLVDMIGIGKPFESVGELFAYGALMTSNTDEISAIVGTIVPLDGGYF